jgi:hypothetical protein
MRQLLCAAQLAQLFNETRAVKFEGAQGNSAGASRGGQVIVKIAEAGALLVSQLEPEGARHRVQLSRRIGEHVAARDHLAVHAPAPTLQVIDVHHLIS